MGTPAGPGGGGIRGTGDAREASPRKCVCLSRSATEDPDRDVGAVRARPRLKNMCGSRDGLLQLLGTVDEVGTRRSGSNNYEPKEEPHGIPHYWHRPRRHLGPHRVCGRRRRRSHLQTPGQTDPRITCRARRSRPASVRRPARDSRWSWNPPGRPGCRSPSSSSAGVTSSIGCPRPRPRTCASSWSAMPRPTPSTP